MQYNRRGKQRSGHSQRKLDRKLRGDKKRNFEGIQNLLVVPDETPDYEKKVVALYVEASNLFAPEAGISARINGVTIDKYPTPESILIKLSEVMEDSRVKESDLCSKLMEVIINFYKIENGEDVEIDEDGSELMKIAENLEEGETVATENAGGGLIMRDPTNQELQMINDLENERPELEVLQRKPGN